jgi:polar amino acid transport system substrate-binding protein
VAFLILISAPCFIFAQDKITASDLTYYTENYPPSNYLQNGNILGVSIDTLKLIWQEMKIPEQEILMVPWARGYRIALGKKNNMLFSMARTKGREDLFKWVGPIYTVKHVLLARADFQHDINKIEDAYDCLIAAIRNDISEVALIEAGYPEKNIALLTDLKQTVLLLENRRLDLIFIAQSSVEKIVEANNLSMDKFKIVMTFNQIGNYYAFNKQTPDRLINEFQQAFNSAAPERNVLLQKYGLSLD